MAFLRDFFGGVLLSAFSDPLLLLRGRTLFCRNQDWAWKESHVTYVMWFSMQYRGRDSLDGTGLMGHDDVYTP